MVQSSSGTGKWGWPDGFCGTGRAAVDTFEGKSPHEPPPWGRFGNLGRSPRRTAPQLLGLQRPRFPGRSHPAHPRQRRTPRPLLRLVLASPARPAGQVAVGRRFGGRLERGGNHNRPIRRERPEIGSGWPTCRFAVHVGHVDQEGLPATWLVPWSMLRKLDMFGRTAAAIWIVKRGRVRAENMVFLLVGMRNRLWGCGWRRPAFGARGPQVGTPFPWVTVL